MGQQSQCENKRPASRRMGGFSDCLHNTTGEGSQQMSILDRVERDDELCIAFTQLDHCLNTAFPNRSDFNTVVDQLLSYMAAQTANEKTAPNITIYQSSDFLTQREQINFFILLSDLETVMAKTLYVSGSGIAKSKQVLVWHQIRQKAQLFDSSIFKAWLPQQTTKHRARKVSPR